MYYISFNNFAKFLDRIKKDYQVYAPVKRGDSLVYERYDEFSPHLLVGGARAVEPLKSFFFRARQLLARQFEAGLPEQQAKPFCIVGAKACDLKGFKVQDFVFSNHDYRDPFYLKARQDNLIIAADCSQALESCFCLSLGVKPYPEENFDIALSQAREGFVVEVGSSRGKALIDKEHLLFEEAKKELISQRQRQRQEVLNQVQENIDKNHIPSQESLSGVVQDKFEAKLWEEQAASCVECGACNSICPTCHCFLLYDQKQEDKFSRLRIWDSCLVKDFARVAGGANPRERLWMRLRNRFEKKFDFFPKVADLYACTGCGRCIQACPAKIDIREVLKKLVGHG